MKPKISIIIRTKNEERWILKCLEQIKRQTLKDYEVILVDNNTLNAYNGLRYLGRAYQLGFLFYGRLAQLVRATDC